MPFRGSGAVSYAVSFLRHSVDFRTCCYDTDAQNTAWLLHVVVTRPSNRSHGVQGVAGSNPAVPIGSKKRLIRQLRRRAASTFWPSCKADAKNLARLSESAPLFDESTALSQIVVVVTHFDA